MENDLGNSPKNSNNDRGISSAPRLHSRSLKHDASSNSFGCAKQNENDSNDLIPLENFQPNEIDNNEILSRKPNAIVDHENITSINDRENNERLDQMSANTAKSDYDTSTNVPDGGWGWLIVVASFAIHVIADGIVYSFGVFFVEFLAHFHGTHSATSWLGSLVPGITLTSGPIASALTNKYGCRPVTIAGSLVASAGFILSMFATSLGYLYITYGIMAGFGFGLIYLPAIVSVTQYFEKRRAFATGLAVCGSGVGTFVFAPFSKWLITTYHWKGALLIEAGVILNCALSGALFRPLKSHLYDKKYSESNNEHEQLLTTCDKNTQILNGDIERQNNISNSSDIVGRRRCHTETLEEKNYPELSKSMLAVPYRSHNYIQHRHHSSNSSLQQVVLQRRDIFYSGSLYNIPQYRSNPALYIASVTSVPPNVDESKWQCWLTKYISPEILNVFRQMLDLSVLKHPIFVMFAISNFLTSIGFNMPFIYLPDRAAYVGIDPTQATFLVSIIGIANTVGRIVFGFLADLSWVNRLWLYNTALMVCGLGTALSPFANTFVTLAIYACVFGIFIGVYVSLTSVVLVDLLGLEKLTNSFGVLLLFQGVATFIGPPIAGWLYDKTGSYDYSFIVEGLMILLSGLMLFAIPCVQRRYQSCTKDRPEAECLPV